MLRRINLSYSAFQSGPIRRALYFPGGNNIWKVIFALFSHLFSGSLYEWKSDFSDWWDWKRILLFGMTNLQDFHVFSPCHALTGSAHARTAYICPNGKFNSVWKSIRQPIWDCISKLLFSSHLITYYKGDLFCLHLPLTAMFCFLISLKLWVREINYHPQPPQRL